MVLHRGRALSQADHSIQCLFYINVLDLVLKRCRDAHSSTNRFALSRVHDSINVNNLCLSVFGSSLVGLICMNVFEDEKFPA